jgi:ABC-2 type transport system ATP-binding protein
VDERIATLTDVLRSLQLADIAVEDVGIRRPTLDEVFLDLTGHELEEKAEAVA